MDLAKYCVNAVLVEGRSMRAVAAATGRSKSWVQCHVALFQAGGEEALVPLDLVGAWSVTSSVEGPYWQRLRPREAKRRGCSMPFPLPTRFCRRELPLLHMRPPRLHFPT